MQDATAKNPDLNNSWEWFMQVSKKESRRWMAIPAPIFKKVRKRGAARRHRDVSRISKEAVEVGK